MPMWARTGRNQPSGNRFIFGLAKWYRFLIQPPPNRSLLYLDYSAEEIAIAAALSGCENRKEAGISIRGSLHLDGDRIENDA